MKTLIAGGTGGIGGYIALALEEQGHKVTLAARHRPKEGGAIAHFPVLLGSYIDDDFSKDQSKGFDNLIFAACNDIRQLPQGLSDKEETAYYRRANSEAVPRFVALARDAGIKNCAYIGSFYNQARPDLIPTSGYIQSRLAADEGVRALAGSDFRVVSLNAPWVVGAVRGGENLLYAGLAKYGRGESPDVPVFAIPGGLNFISVQSLTEATIASLTKGENGRGYLVGDENLHFKDFFGYFFKAAGRGDVDIPVRDEPHPLWPDVTLLAGRAGTIFYEPEGVAEFGYRLNDIERTVKDIVDITP